MGARHPRVSGAKAIKHRIARRRAEEEGAGVLLSATDDEVGGSQSAIRVERSDQHRPVRPWPGVYTGWKRDEVPEVGDGQ